MIGGGRLCLRRMWGNMLMKTIFKKSSAKATIAVTAAKCQELAVHRYAVFSGRRFCDVV